VALHAGTAEWRDGDYFGPALNRAARLLAAGHGGQVLLSAAAQELLADQLPEAVDDLQAAEPFFEESLRISRELNDAEQEGWTTFNLGLVAAGRGDLDDAERCYQHSLTIFARLGYKVAQAQMLYELAMFAEQRGDHAAADGYLARALALIDRFGLAAGFSPLIERGRLACQRGDYQRA